MKESINAKYLKLALEIMNNEQLTHFQKDIDIRMEYLKTHLIEHELDTDAFNKIKEEYTILKEIRSKFVVDLTIAKF
jgi:hypothetical protein